MEMNRVDVIRYYERNGAVEVSENPAFYVSSIDDETRNIPKRTIPEALVEIVNENPNFITFKSKSNKEGKFDISISLQEYLELTKKAARSFLKLRLEAKCAVCILGFNHTAWCISQTGCIFASGLACGIYTTNSPELCAFIINDCSCQIVVVENNAHLSKILSIVDQCPQIRAIIQYTGDVSNDIKTKSKISIYTWKEFLDLGSEDQTPELENRLKNAKPKDTAILIYTSGTTGMPKGVMLSHDNVLYASQMLAITYSLKRFCHCVVSYLPFSHIAANSFDLINAITLGVTVYFAQPDALKGSLNKTLLEVRPTAFLGVPRVFEKIQEKMQELFLELGGLKKYLFNWAQEVGNKSNIAKEAGKSPDCSFRMANFLIFSKVKKSLGLDRCEYLASGAAPMAQKTLEYFLNIDIRIHQVYGLSESGGPHTSSQGEIERIGTVGTLVKGVETKILEPDKNGIGEICMRGRHIFLGYYHAEQKTAETLDKEGWLHTGDLGKLDNDGSHRITGRIKELIITAGGENIAPVPIEDRIKEKLPFVSNAVLIGDKRKFISCLLTFKTTVDFETQRPTSMLSPNAIHSLAEIGIVAKEIEDVLGSHSSVLKTKVDEAIKEVNSCSVSNAAYVQKWTFLPNDFSIQEGELGPTMKMKRSVITDKYHEIIDRMYI